MKLNGVKCHLLVTPEKWVCDNIDAINVKNQKDQKSPLTWRLHGITSSNCVNNTHEKALRLAYKTVLM